MNSIRTRLTVLNVSVLILVLLLLGVIVFFMARSSLIRSVDRVLIDRSGRFLRPPGGFAGGGGGGFWGSEGGPPGGHPPPGRGGPGNPMRVFDGQGRSIGPPGEEPYDREALEASKSPGAKFSTITMGDEPYRVYTVSVSDGNGVRFAQLVEPLAPTYRAVGVLTSALLTMIPAGVLLAAVGGLYLTGRALKPVRDMQKTAEIVSGENLSGRLKIVGNDEFAQMGQTINRMLDRLENAFGRLKEALERQRRFTADASHELKTPLTVIKSNVGLALSQDRAAEEYRRTLGAVDTAATKMNTLVSDLLTLARADAGGMPLKASRFDLDQPILNAVEVMRQPTAAPIEFEPDAEPIFVNGDEAAIERVFLNLLSNAVQHTPANGKIKIETAASGMWVKIAVRDTGKGIPASHLPHLTERFYRVDAARSGGGTGLGLAICQEIVAAHRGEIRFESEVGKGTTVTVTLPLAPRTR